MRPTSEQIDRLREILSHLINQNERWLRQHDIVWGHKAPYWILNYGTRDRNEYNRLLRGMVVRQPAAGFRGDKLKLIASFPFIRFFNRGEKEADPIDLSSTEMLEKLDGTMVGVFFPDGERKPHFHTRKMLCTHMADMRLQVSNFQGKRHAFMPSIEQYVKRLDWRPSDAHFTYIFEFVHSASLVITKYRPQQYGLYLIGARSLKTWQELSEAELDLAAARIGAWRPRRWDALSSFDEIQTMMRKIGRDTPAFEGFVFRDRVTGGRQKVKDVNYLKKRRLIANLSIKNLLPVVLEGEAEEVCAYFPEARPYVEEIGRRIDDYVIEAVQTVIHWRDRAIREQMSRKRLALEVFGPKDQGGVKDKFLGKHIMSLYQEPDDEKIRREVDHEFRKMALGAEKSAKSPRRLVGLLGLKDETLSPLLFGKEGAGV